VARQMLRGSVMQAFILALKIHVRYLPFRLGRGVVLRLDRVLQASWMADTEARYRRWSYYGIRIFTLGLGAIER